MLLLHKTSDIHQTHQAVKIKIHITILTIKIKSNNKLREINIKNRTCYYFDDIINIGDYDLLNILLDENTHKNFLIYNVEYKHLYGSKH